jgi:predicted thioesterase
MNEEKRPWAERMVTVSADLTATHFGSGAVEVYATPAMISLMESAALEAIVPYLEEGQTSVGVLVDIRHLAATPVGEKVRARAEVIAVEGRKITFSVTARDEHELIGEGRHTRMIVEKERFLERVRSKKSSGPVPGAE